MMRLIPSRKARPFASAHPVRPVLTSLRVLLAQKPQKHRFGYTNWGAVIELDALKPTIANDAPVWVLQKIKVQR